MPENSKSGGSWWDAVLKGLEMYSNYQGGKEMKEDYEQSQSDALKLWEKGYWSHSSPYMAEAINPMLQAVLQEQFKKYNSSKSGGGLDLASIFAPMLGGAGQFPGGPGGSGGSGGPLPSSGNGMMPSPARPSGAAGGVSSAPPDFGGLPSAGGAGAYDIGSGTGGAGGGFGLLSNAADWAAAHPKVFDYGAKIGQGAGAATGNPVLGMAGKAFGGVDNLLQWLDSKFGRDPSWSSEPGDMFGSMFGAPGLGGAPGGYNGDGDGGFTLGGENPPTGQFSFGPNAPGGASFRDEMSQGGSSVRDTSLNPGFTTDPYAGSASPWDWSHGLQFILGGRGGGDEMGPRMGGMNRY